MGRMAAIPIARPFLGVEEERAAAEVLRSRWLTQGPRVAEFEAAFARYVGAPHAVAMSSCTTALHALWVALGVGPGDEVVCPSHSFIATANAIVHAGARPVFADVDDRSYNLDPAAVERAITNKTRAILAVHQVGLPADLDGLAAIARARGLILIEDAACAAGSSYRGAPIGRPVGVAAAFSFHPRKILCCGEGGMVTTTDGELAARLRRLRHHGMTVSDLERHNAKGRYQRESYAEVGYNYRLSDVQAAIGLVQLGRLDEMVAKRRELAARYAQLLDGAPVELPHAPPGCAPNFQSYVVRLRGRGREGRDRVIDALVAEEIAARAGVMAAHREPPYAMGASGNWHLPVTDAVTDETLLLPMFHELTEPDQARVAAALRRAL